MGESQQQVPSNSMVFILLSLAFLSCYTPQNALAPNLTECGEEFNILTAKSRDWFLGTVLSICQHVLSLPIAAGLGLLCDRVDRITLFSLITGGVGACCILTSLVRNFTDLAFVRFLTGGLYMGSVVVAFSIASDLFEAKKRNAACAALAAAMGTGVLIGQLVAGMYGESAGWRFPFFILGVPNFMIAFAMKTIVTDPVKGGKEAALKEMISSGGSYDVQLNWVTFKKAMSNRTTSLLILQSFVGSVPWGLIFIYLNDFLTQEKGMPNSDATAIIGVFGAGAGVGAVAGGWAGQLSYQINRSYLPVMMSVTQLLGTLPCLLLINTSSSSATPEILFYAFVTGCLANIAGINVRPALINVNLPEARPAALSVANLAVNLARGLSPILVTMIQVVGGTRLTAFNLVVPVSWIVTSFMLMMLVKTFVDDEDIVQYNLGLFVLNQRESSNNLKSLNKSGKGDSDEEAASFIEKRFPVLSQETVHVQGLGVQTAGSSNRGRLESEGEGVVNIVRDGLVDIINVFSTSEEYVQMRQQ